MIVSILTLWQPLASSSNKLSLCPELRGTDHTKCRPLRNLTKMTRSMEYLTAPFWRCLTSIKNGLENPMRIGLCFFFVQPISRARTSELIAHKRESCSWKRTRRQSNVGTRTGLISTGRALGRFLWFVTVHW